MIQIKNMAALKYLMAIVLLSSAVFISCQKSKIEPVETYPEAPVPLVKFLDGGPSPAIGSQGSVVTFNVSGLKGKEGQFTFFINQTLAEVVEVTESSVKVKVPDNASTGGSAVLINGEYYFGPTFTVRGKVSIDPLFNTDAFRSNAPIHGIFKRADGSSYLIYGDFTNYKTQATAANPITGIAVLNGDGDYLPLASQLKLGTLGFNGPVQTVIQQPDGKYLVSGSFSKYDTVSNINNITRLNSDGTLDRVEVDILNTDPVGNPDGGKALVPTYNGGTLGGGGEIFYNSSTGTTTMAGNFFAYTSIFYERSTKDGPFFDLVDARQMIRMKQDGGFDSSFNYNAALKKSYEGGNGFIYDVIQLPDGKLIVAGNFTNFNGEKVNYITRLNATDGLVDPAFNAGKSGADGYISRITYNSTTGKILLTGNFKNYNGQPANGVVMINANGDRDAAFNFGTVENGVPNYAGQLKNGKIMVSGSFSKYNGVVRPGFLILNADGSLASGYNNTGLFRGTIYDFVELTSSGGVPAVTIVGSFDRFDNKEVGNIVKFRIEN
jgi:uncharacterized delta-60 repeat protein